MLHLEIYSVPYRISSSPSTPGRPWSEDPLDSPCFMARILLCARRPVRARCVRKPPNRSPCALLSLSVVQARLALARRCWSSLARRLQGSSLYQSSVIAVPLSASVLYNYKKFQFGAAIETSTINYKSRYQPDFGILPYITLNNRVHETPVKLFANKLLHFKKIEGYVGLSGLYNFLKSAGNEFVQTSHTSSIGFGAQAGATYFISKHIGFNAEISGRSNNFPAGPLDKNIITVPVTIGFRYKL